MKPPSSWTPDEAKEVEDYLREAPDDTHAAQQYALYKMKQDERASYDKSTSFKPEHNPGGLTGLRMLLPNILGGNTATFVEPSREEFNSKVKLAPGEDAEQAYQDYKDAEWTRTVNAHRKAGVPIVRSGQTSEERRKAEASAREDIASHPGKSILGITAKGLTGYTLPSADEAIAGGLDAVGLPKMGQYLREAEKMVGPYGTAAEIAGSLAPGSLIGKAAGGLKAAMGPAKTALGALGKGIAAGAATGVGAGATGDVLHGVGEALKEPSEDTKVLVGDVRPMGSEVVKDTLADMALRTPARALVGGLLGAIPGAGQALRTANRDLAGSAGNRMFAAIEAAGGTGLKTPPGVAAVKPGLYEHPTDLVIEDAAPKIARSIVSRIKPPTPVETTMEAKSSELLPHDPEEAVKTATGLEPITHRGTAWAHSERYPGPPPSGEELPAASAREPAPTIKEPVTPVQPSVNTPEANAKTLPSVSTDRSPQPSMGDKLDEVSRLLKAAGVKTFDMNPENPQLLAEIRQALHKAHFGEGSTEHNRALMALAGNDPDAVKALRDVLAAKAVSAGATEGGIPGVPLNPLRWPGAVASAASKNRYRMDPIAGWLADKAGRAAGQASKVADPLTQALIDLQSRSNH